MKGDCDQKMYELNCKQRFDAHDEMLKELKSGQEHMHAKLFVSNGDRAMTEKVRDNKKNNERLEEKLEKHITESSKDDKPPAQKTMKMSIGKFFQSENMDWVQVFKVGCAAVGVLFLGLLVLREFNII